MMVILYEIEAVGEQDNLPAVPGRMAWFVSIRGPAALASVFADSGSLGLGTRRAALAAHILCCPFCHFCHFIIPLLICGLFHLALQDT